jgi:hypothetical protein
VAGDVLAAQRKDRCASAASIMPRIATKAKHFWRWPRHGGWQWTEKHQQRQQASGPAL